jgi:hypothetical protein
MPVSLRRLTAGRQPREVHAELVEPDGVAETLARTARNRDMVGIRIAGADLGL